MPRPIFHISGFIIAPVQAIAMDTEKHFLALATASNGDKPDIWYLAYGSNMSRAKFTGSRGIVPKKAARVRVPGWTLAMNIPGLPYSEPTFLSVVPRADRETTPPRTGASDMPKPNSPELSTNKAAVPTSPVWEPARMSKSPKKGAASALAAAPPDVLGVAYLVTAAQYVRVLASEGGGTAYEDICLAAVPVGPADRELTGSDSVDVHTLGSAMVREPWPRPSRRYMDIVATGACEADLPAYYRAYLDAIRVYEPLKGRRGRVGAAIFLAVWGPVMELLERVTNATMGEDGYVPRVVVWLVRGTIWVIWLVHDVFFAPLVGRGDGLDARLKGRMQDNEDEGEKQLLLSSENAVCYLV